MNSAKKHQTRFNRLWTNANQDPLDAVKWKSVSVCIKSYATGDVIYENANVMAPESWSQNAVDTVASKYFRRSGVPGIEAESSVGQLIDRVAQCLTDHGKKEGYFINEEEANSFHDDLVVGFLTQKIGFNSPVWFNFGLYSKYGITGSKGRKRYFFDSEKQDISSTDDELVRPGGAACFLSAVDDSLFNDEEFGMFDHIANETKIFLTGAGDGFNASNIRGRGEPIKGGGISSGLLSYLKPRDAAAGYIKSGGKTRRSATLICLDMDHPDIEDFILWKGNEEKKAQALIHAGYPSDYEGEAYQTITGQNSNNSVRISNIFMKCLQNEKDWYLISRQPYFHFTGALLELDTLKSVPVEQGTLYYSNMDEPPVAILPRGTSNNCIKKIMGVRKAKDLWNMICQTAWECGCPGVQFDDTINDWNTVPHYGRINTTNPCAEICLPDWSVCNLGSVNLMPFFQDLNDIDWKGYEHACKLITIALDLIVDISSYPTAKHALGSYNLRSIGLNHGNIGAVLMRNAIAYDSSMGRFFMSAITSAMTLFAWEQSHELSIRKGSYPVYDYDNHKLVLDRHRSQWDIVFALRYSLKAFPCDLSYRWDQIRTATGFRNNTTTALVPQGTIGLVLDQDTMGCEPDFSLVKYKKCVGGNHMKIVNGQVVPALKKMGYFKEEEISAIENYILEFGTAEGAPYLTEGDQNVFSTAVCPPNTSEKSFKNVISIDGHINALAAFQPHISMSISKTCNLDNDATVEDVSKAYLDGWEKGIKCIAVYRDGSKKSQPLNATKKSEVLKTIDESQPEQTKKSDDWRKIWPAIKRQAPNYTPDSDCFKIVINDPVNPCSVFLHIDRYPGTNDAMHVFVDVGRQGETLCGMIEVMARLISRSVQHGVPLEHIADVLEGMKFGPQGMLGKSSVFGIRYANSIPDVVGKVLRFLPSWWESGRDEKILHPAPYDSFAPVVANVSEEKEQNTSNTWQDIDSPANAKRFGFTGLHCKNCGSLRTSGSVSCFLCQDCGTYNGPCGS